ncbi:hypothetical protein AJ79_02642 [Helicocarpus griseus UAMH5409]|uniref:DNA (cytosine-5-)-methyltransferase n=1 Tax=Helicocarpus griseus UAMH5409 TaxID=1447875 RepID=A0A2B7Y0X4_9EURO|nr:hypothetical protein AJ79_02642 [Helicocarpus griseus UAMH5409]
MVSSIISEDLNADLEISNEEHASSQEREDGELEENQPGKPLDSLVGVSLPALIYPKSVYSGHEPPQPKSRERDAVSALLSKPGAIDRQTYAERDFISLELEDFVIYALPPASPSPHGMVSLDQVAGRAGRQKFTFFFDGVLKAPGKEGERFYLERVPFHFVSVGGYEDVEQHGVGKDIWIQSPYGSHTSFGDLWYQLGTPAPEYREYFRLFVWLADLAKHLVDYLHDHEDVMVTLRHFKSDFSSWLNEKHGSDPSFVHWMDQYKSLDFRQAINAYSNFLQKQAWDLGGSYGHHPLWGELGVTQDTRVIEEQPQEAVNTIVTPYVFQCFRNMVWANHLNSVELEPQISARHQSRLEELGFFQRGKTKTKSKRLEGFDGAEAVSPSPRDVIAIRRDHKTPWKGTEDLWYALVQDVHPRKNRPARLSVVWLYRPSETVCANMTYPHENELFLSDHCNCGDGVIDTSEIVKKVKVTFFSHQVEKGAEFFIRQTYFSDDETFASLKEEHLNCRCRKPAPKPDFVVGDTVLVESFGESDPDNMHLEPAEILEIKKSQVSVRILPRRERYDDSDCRPNELVYTNRTRSVHVDQVERRCHVRFYTEEQKRSGSITAPYNRDGTGDAFYITSKEVSSEKASSEEGPELVTLQHLPEGFKEGFNPSEGNSFPKLRALNIFSGGGNFDRGLGEGGAITNEWAVEWGTVPMLTYRANHDDPEKMKLFLGSVNDFLLQASQGKDNDLVAKLGEVQFISAGSPCQGYSNVNGKKENEVSMRNSSMIASVASYVDFYRPKYAILENVIAMSSRSHKQNPLCQLVCAFVGMGYQLRILNLDAWSFGAPQSRSRLFILIAAPGLNLPEHPPLTHAHPPKTTQRSLGQAPNGLPFGKRHWGIPVFDFLSASKSSRDLPRIGVARIAPINHPDHRTTRIESPSNQHILNSTPKAPWVSGLKDSVARGFLTAEEGGKRANEKIQRAWSRVHPHLLMPTVTTFPSPYCKFTGRWLHWEEDRLMSVIEVRRAQGFPEGEVLIGSPSQQWKVAGNSVARQVALALGLVVREACLKNQRGEGQGSGVVTANGVENGVGRVNGENGQLMNDEHSDSDGFTKSETDAALDEQLRRESAVVHPAKSHDENDSHGELSDAVALAENSAPSYIGPVIKNKSFRNSILAPWRVRSETTTIDSNSERTLQSTPESDSLAILSPKGKRALSRSSNGLVVSSKKRKVSEENKSRHNGEEFWNGFT